MCQKVLKRCPKYVHGKKKTFFLSALGNKKRPTAKCTQILKINISGFKQF